MRFVSSASAIRSGDWTAARAAASSKASGIPSRRLRIATTAGR